MRLIQRSGTEGAVRAALEGPMRALAAVMQGGMWIPPALPWRQSIATFDRENYTRYGYLYFAAT